MGWKSYLEDEEGLLSTLASSFCVFAARTDGGEVIGLARTTSDGYTSAHIQDTLVWPESQRRGVGGALLDELLERTEHIR